LGGKRKKNIRGEEKVLPVAEMLLVIIDEGERSKGKRIARKRADRQGKK